MREFRGKLAVVTGALSDNEVRAKVRAFADAFRDKAPMTAAAILEGVREERWRILVGEDAAVLDRLVREAPEGAYGEAFMERLRSQSTWRLGG